MSKNRSEMLRPGDVAKMLGVHITTLKSFERLKFPLMPSVLPSGHRRFARRDVLAFARKHKFKVG